MPSVTLTVKNDTGLHSRPADLFVRTAKLYDSQLTVHKGEKSANAKNIVKLILLNVSQHTEITIEAEGTDAEKALHDLQTLVESDFKTVNEAVTI